MSLNDTKKTHQKGLIAEIEFIRYFLKNDWNIYKPLDQNSRADLVIEKNGEFKKIQIKYCTPYKGVLRVELTHPYRTMSPYTSQDVDEIGVYDGMNEKFYLMPLSDILPRKEMWIRIDSLSKKQLKNVHWAEKYLIK